MANIKGLGDLKGEDSGSDDGGDFNDYYAGGEKRCGARGAKGDAICVG